jgi:hypothetical protein
MNVVNYQRGAVNRKAFMGVSPEYDTTYGLTQALFDRGLVTGYNVTNVGGTNPVTFRVPTSIDLQKDFKLLLSGRHLKLIKNGVAYPNTYEVLTCSSLGVNVYNTVVIKNVLGVTDAIPTDFTSIQFACPRAKEALRADIIPSVEFGASEFYWPAQNYFTSNDGYVLNGWQWVLLPKVNPAYPQINRWRYKLGSKFYEVYDIDAIPEFTGTNTGDEVIVRDMDFSVVIDGVTRVMQLIMWRCKIGANGVTTPTPTSDSLNLILNKNT